MRDFKVFVPKRVRHESCVATLVICRISCVLLHVVHILKRAVYCLNPICVRKYLQAYYESREIAEDYNSSMCILYICNSKTILI